MGVLDIYLLLKFTTGFLFKGTPLKVKLMYFESENWIKTEDGRGD